MAAKPLPDGYHTLTPMLIVDGANSLMEFLKKAFGAEVRMSMPMPDGRIAHAEMTIGDSAIMVSDATPEFPAMKVGVHIYVADVDTVYARALQAGARKKQDVQDQFYGDRSGSFYDPAGNLWSVATHVEDISDEEMERRMAAMAPSGN
jgi:PhnB protein